jgi:hypothetical protein
MMPASSRRWGAIVTCSFLSCLCCPGHAHAFVHSTTCPNVDLELVTQLAVIELRAPGQPRGEVDGLRVELTCTSGNDWVTISVWDPITEKRMQRDVSGVSGGGAERTLALIISQLYKASWSELLISADSAVDTKASPSDVAAAKAVVHTTFLDRPDLWILTSGAGIRWRAGDKSITAAHLHLGVGRLLEKRWIPGVYSGFDMGENDVATGSVRFFIWAIGVTGTIRFNPLRHLLFEVGLHAGATYSLLRGRTDSPGLKTTDISGFSGEALITAGPGIRMDSLILGFHADFGYALRYPKAGVGGGKTMTLGGIYGGISLRISYGVAGRHQGAD